MRDLGSDPVAQNIANRANAKALEGALGVGEEVLEVVEARRRGLTLGLLAATNSRLVFAQDRLFRGPLCVTHAYRDIIFVSTAVGPVIGRVDLEMRDGSTATYRTIWPKERTNSLAEAIGRAAQGEVLASHEDQCPPWPCPPPPSPPP